MITPARTVDALGLLCPLPILRTAQELKRLPVGSVLEVLSDDPGVLEDMPAWCGDTGHELLEIRTAGTVYHAFVKKTHDDR